jgi:N-acylglucosamine-6-phosphate 2-epimerase
MTGTVVERLRGGLIVSCQAPQGSPLDDPRMISVLALTAAEGGAVGVRLNGPGHVAAVRRLTGLPIIGIDKVETAGSEVYITPTFAAARGLAESGADLIALDATRRRRPGGELLGELIRRVRGDLGLPVMADVATEEEGREAAESGADIIATTLCGYTAETSGAALPALDLVERLASRLGVPVICEGGVASPEQLRRAFDCGAFAVVVGTAITGVGRLVRQFAAAAPRARTP